MKLKEIENELERLRKDWERHDDGSEGSWERQQEIGQRLEELERKKKILVKNIIKSLLQLPSNSLCRILSSDDDELLPVELEIKRILADNIDANELKTIQENACLDAITGKSKKETNKKNLSLLKPKN